MRIFNSLATNELSVEDFVLYQRQLLIDTYIFAYCTYDELNALHQAATKHAAKQIVQNLQYKYRAKLQENWRNLHDPKEWDYDSALDWEWDRYHEPIELYQK